MNDLNDAEARARVVIVCDPASEKAALRDIFFKSGKNPVSCEWIMDCVSHYRLLDAQRNGYTLLDLNADDDDEDEANVQGDPESQAY